MTPLAPSASADPMRPASGQICSVQSLRAIAALFVVIFHSTVLWHDKFTPSIVPWTNGNSGVDLFFVISGFIMVRADCKASRTDGASSWYSVWCE
jgi:exopolysaccharide production protein ExoZ